MITDPIDHNDIRYNAAQETFEALVTIHGAGAPVTYATTLEAPLDLPLELAEKQLRARALWLHENRAGLRSLCRVEQPTPPAHTMRRAPGRSRMAWLKPFLPTQAA